MIVRIRDRSGSVVKSYDVERRGGESVRNVLDRIRESLDPALAYDVSCGTGKCGVCGMSIDGVSRLACTCPAEGDELDLAPLSSGALVRDLLTINEMHGRRISI